MKARSWIICLLLAGLAGACGLNRPPSPAVPTPAPGTGVQLNAPTSTPDAGVPLNAPASTPAPQLPTTSAPTVTSTGTTAPTATPTPTLHPLTIAAMRARGYPGSAVTIESTLDPGVNYKRYIASYESEGLKIYGLLTVPNGTPPADGWPVIVFNHGYIPPAQYRTTGRYVAYQDWLARSGFIVFKPDYRGNGGSEGAASGAYGSPDYVVDVLNAVTSMEHYPGADHNLAKSFGLAMTRTIAFFDQYLKPSS